MKKPLFNKNINLQWRGYDLSWIILFDYFCEMDAKPFSISLPKILDDRGNLSFIEELNHIPFKIKRSYWIYDVPGGEIRGGHSYKYNEELIIALSGSFTLVTNDGVEQQEFLLNRSYMGVYVPAGIWRHMENFSTNSLALILSSTEYDEDDYERDIDTYLKLKNQ